MAASMETGRGTEGTEEQAAAADVLTPVKREADDLAQHARQSARTIADEGGHAAADYVWALSAAVRSGADELQQRRHEHTAAVIRQAAGDCDRLAQTLSERGVGDAVDAVNDFARHHPVIFFGAAALAGAGLVQLLGGLTHKQD